MCIIDRKIYLHSDGRRETVETTTRCDRASGRNLCRHVVRREARGAQLVEITPSTDRTPAGGVTVADGRGVRTREYRPESNRSSGSSSVRRSRTMSERSSLSTPSSASSPSYPEPKTAGPMPPPLTETLPSPLERRRQPYPPIPPPGMIIAPDGTAQYSRPPSLSMERATEVERPSSSAGERTLPRQNSSFSSTKAEIDGTESGPSKLPRKPSIKVKTDIRSSTSSSTPSIESPGLSNLPGVGGHHRKDSAKDVPQRQSSRHVRYPSESDRERRKAREGKRPETPRRRGTEDDRLRKDAEARRRREEDRSSRDEERRRREQEDDRQARIERDRLAESDHRQSARDELAREAARARLRDITDPPRSDSIPREASRERHRLATFAALEGQSRQEEEEDYDPAQPYIDADEEQMARERAAAARRRESATEMPPPPPQFMNDQLRREAELRTSPRRPVERPVVRSRGYSYNTSPTSARSPLSPRPQPVVHQYQYPSARHSGTIPQRGAEVLAREQARGSRGSGGGGLNDAFANMNVGTEGEGEDGEGYYYPPGQEGGGRRKGFWP